ncbi:PREDICTED: 15-hydroxyprostaglandin dehydrogenase [NAD(+)]-like [Nicrophorus vespilloides]|uniref:15-hydroxyprostaglandin dehydrogenase [NAD(+)]-like n=1 Tax=Nicrophorus vespilloides TaxID=110193 RepID=A0ABM1M4B0_NICVS|nr:PREDICTED: 15-hydroxyprostaglandin dehydrogenase [NAD(+)]-like [Nicrophorus vespilloides]
MGYDFNGKVAVVTGGADGIGLCIVKELLLNGVKGVVIADINVVLGENAVKELGTDRTCFIRTDVTNSAQLEDSFKLAISTFGGLDIVCNNAGIFNERNWRLTINVNINAVVDGVLLAFRYLGKNHGGKGGIIMSTSSIFGVQPNPCAPIYSATKFFVNNLTRALGTPFYYNLTGVKLVTVCPGMTETTMPLGAQGLEDMEGLPQYMQQNFSKLIPQTAEHAAKGAIIIMKEGANGSTWVVAENKPPYEHKPDMPTSI